MLIHLQNEIACLVGAAGALVGRDFWVRTERPRSDDGSVLDARRAHFARRLALLDPARTTVNISNVSVPGPPLHSIMPGTM